AIKRELVAALDDWYQVTTMSDNSTANSKRRPGRKELLDVARLADPDPWRGRLRDAIQRGDAAALTSLAAEDDVLAQPVATVLLLARALESRDPNAIDDAQAAALLRQLQRRYPADFWVNFELANSLPKDQLDNEIAFRRVAVALRPDSPNAQDAL